MTAPIPPVRGPARPGDHARAPRPPRVHPPGAALGPPPRPGALPRRGCGAAAHRQRHAQRRRARRAPERVPRAGSSPALGQEFGFPVPEGGSGELTACARSPAHGARRRGPLRGTGRAASRCATGARSRSCSPTARTIAAPRGVLADVGGARALPRPRRRGAPARARASTTSAASSTTWRRSRSTGRCRDRSRGGHRGGDARRHRPPRPTAWTSSRRYAADLAQDQIPAPAVRARRADEQGRSDAVAGGHRDGVGVQPRSVPGRAATRAETLRGVWDASEAEAFADRLEAEIEAFAPGFRALVTGRHLLPPPALEAARRQPRGRRARRRHHRAAPAAVFRPIPGLGRAETPVRGLFLASASAHPGGGVHGACGANAARAAIFADRVRRVTGRAQRALRPRVMRGRGQSRSASSRRARRRTARRGEVEDAGPLDVGRAACR